MSNAKTKSKKILMEERKAIAKQLIQTSGLASGDWVALDTICNVRDYVLKHHDRFSDVFPKTFLLPTKEALVGETSRRVIVNMLRRCAKVSGAAIIRKKTQKWENGGNLTRYTYKLLSD